MEVGLQFTSPRQTPAYKFVPSNARPPQKHFTLEHSHIAYHLKMTKLHILLLTSLPLCLAQFSIQGPSDGNRAAQGLKYSKEKGIEYTDQRASLGTGDFTIQGATDGHSNFNIQGATDSNSQFQIQGATDGNADFRIQGATDGHSQSSIQGPYDANLPSARALQYDDPSGLKVNWRTYARSPEPQAYPEPQYAAETAAPQRTRVPQPSQQAHQHQTQVPVQQPINYRPYSKAPDQIKQLLQFQAQIPYMNVIPEQFRYDALASAQAQAQQVQDHYQSQSQQSQAPEPAGNGQYQGQYRAKSRGPARYKRQAPQHQGQPASQSQYRRISQPPAEPQPHYSPNVPQQIQQLLKYQAQLPYDNTANRIIYRPDKPYVPQPVQQSAPNNAVQYQGQGQGSYSQGQGAYGQASGSVRPVNERQY